VKKDDRLTESSVVRALAHPLRVRILRILDERTASPRELAQELEAPLGNVSYHVRTLAQLGLIKLVRRRQRRGAVEHYYRAHVRPVIANEDWEDLPGVAKTAMVHANLTTTFEHVGQAGRSGGFDRADSHLSRTTIEVDEAAWKEVSGEIQAIYDRVRKLGDAAAKRGDVNGDGGRRTATVVLMLFEGTSSAPETAPTGDGDGDEEPASRAA
jgi:DNA-binding transcriptional ArsR family regulator